jgi:TetR/AcrR family transcriptional repressor of nem operon
MRYSSDQKLQTRNRVLKAAAAQIRTHGPQGIGVAALMKEAGLTHGGFYAHFASKDALIAAAVKTMFEDATSHRHRAIDQRSGPAALGAFIDNYLSPDHRDRPDRGCPVACLIGQSAHLPALARPAFDTGVRGMVRLMASYLPENMPDPMALASSMIAELAGALALSRAVEDETLSLRLLEQSRLALRARAGLTLPNLESPDHDH